MVTKSNTFMIGAVIAACLAGFFFGTTLKTKPTQEQVRDALYEQCVNSASYAPKAGNIDDTLHCNRRSIDLMLAFIYNGSYVPPIDVEKYEAELDKFKHSK